MHDVVLNVVLRGHCVISIFSRLMWIDVASVNHYLNAIKAKQSALDARKPLVGGLEPRLCSWPFGSSFSPSSLAPERIQPLAE